MIIVDTSVAFKWFSRKEDYREQSLKILNRHLTGESFISVPDLFFYELSNAWTTKTLLPIDQIHEYLNNLQSFQLKTTPVSFNLLTNAADFSKKYHISVYDACYAVFADEKGCDLITADAKFVRQVNLPFIKLLE